MSSAVGELAIDALRAAGAGALDVYCSALRGAFAKAPPVFGHRDFGDAFRERARDPGWFAGLLMSNVDLEGYSATQLWRYADTLPPEHAEMAAAIRRHARDESRHARVFGNILMTLFPDLDRPDFRDRLRRVTPDLDREIDIGTRDNRPFEELLNTAVLVNLFEIKALVLVRLLAPVAIAYCPESSRDKVAAATRRLAADEIEHIRYTAEFIEAAAAAGHERDIRSAIADFQHTLNLTTAADLERDHAGLPA